MSTDLNKADKDKLLDQWERTSFKIYGLFRKDSRTKVGDYVRVAKDIQKNSSSNQNIDGLIKLIADIALDKETKIIEFDINSSVIDEEMKKDCYNGWEKKLRYFFYRYEEYLFKNSDKKRSNPNKIAWSDIWSSSLSKTIEHVLPQKPEEKEWDHFTAEERAKYLHSIGNLCLLPQDLNNEADNKSFSHKKGVYKKSEIKAFDFILFENENSERQEWDKEAIENRTEQLIKFAKEQWKDL